MDKKNVSRELKRNFIQLMTAALINGYAIGFKEGRIYRGSTKRLCVPVLNCYSCPGALGACPIGSMQSVLCGNGSRVSFYILGVLMLFGVILGRAVCGFLCPFGLMQGVLYKIPFIKKNLPKRADRILRYVKYLVLILFVVLLPIFARNEFGIGTTWFCKYICPAGTLEAGVPLLITNASLRTSIGGLFYWKASILIVLILASFITYRPFCKYLCPLGAFYGLFAKISMARMELDKSACTECHVCEKKCDMQVDILKNINSAECIQCGKCIDVCPNGAIKRRFGLK